MHTIYSSVELLLVLEVTAEPENPNNNNNSYSNDNYNNYSNVHKQILDIIF